MAQRKSGYERRRLDNYETPPWATEALVSALKAERLLPRGPVWEPCAGSGKMVRALRAGGLEVIASDVTAHDGLDFVADFTHPEGALELDAGARHRAAAGSPQGSRGAHFKAIITNPPYGLVDETVRRAIDLMRPAHGLVAMLLKSDWDWARTRADLFAPGAGLALRLALVGRVTWIDPVPGKAGPSENHAWFVWDFRRRLLARSPVMRWAAIPETETARLAALRRKPKPAAAPVLL